MILELDVIVEALLDIKPGEFNVRYYLKMEIKSFKAQLLLTIKKLKQDFVTLMDFEFSHVVMTFIFTLIIFEQ